MTYKNNTFRIGFILMLAAQALIVIYAFLVADSTTTGFQTCARLSGRLSLAVFSWILIAHLRDQHYKSLFLIFAVAHGIHMVELISYQYMIGNISTLFSARIAGGMLAYTFIYLMPVIQGLPVRQQLSRKVIIKIEYLYLFFIWLSFVMAYIPRVFTSGKIYGGSYIEFVIFFAWLLILLVIKAFQIIRTPNPARISQA